MKRTTGFTIVELLIVIVVIGILAAISIVAYNNVAAKARDSQRKQDLSNIAKALHMYKVNHGDMVLSGSGSGGAGNGWFNVRYSSGLQSMAQLLVSSGELSAELVDPINYTSSCGPTGQPCRAYMKYTCSLGTYLYASLESEPSGHDGPTNNTCAPTWDTAYNMNYVIKVE